MKDSFFIKDALIRTVKDAEARGDKTILFPVIDAKKLIKDIYEKDFVEWFYTGSYITKEFGSGRTLGEFYEYWLTNIKNK